MRPAPKDGKDVDYAADPLSQDLASMRPAPKDGKDVSQGWCNLRLVGLQ